MQRVAAYLQRSLADGRLSNFGPVNQLFTDRLSQAVRLDSRRRLLTTSSGHTALMAAYAALNVKSLAMPAFTFESTRSAARLQGIDVKLVDVDARTGCVSPTTLARLDPATYDSVVAVCALSTVPDIAEMTSFCRSRGKRLIIDGAATWGTPDIANYGDAFCYSFHATKTLPVGEGGALVIDAAHYDRALAYVNFGRDVDRRAVIDDGHAINGKMSEYTAAIGMAVLDALGADVDARRSNTRLYRRYLGELVPSSARGDETVYAFLPTFAPTVEDAVAARKALTAANMPHLAYYVPVVDLTVARDLYDRSVCLPVHGGLDADAVESVARTYLGST